jgi:hypothetical protein
MHGFSYRLFGRTARSMSRTVGAAGHRSSHSVLLRLLSMLPDQRWTVAGGTSRVDQSSSLLSWRLQQQQMGGGQILEIVIRRSWRILCRAGRKACCMILGRGDIHEHVSVQSHNGDGQVRDDPIHVVQRRSHPKCEPKCERMQQAERGGQRHACGRNIVAAEQG